LLILSYNITCSAFSFNYVTSGYVRQQYPSRIHFSYLLIYDKIYEVTTPTYKVNQYNLVFV